MNIYEFPMPNDVNGEQLKNELNANVVYQTGNVLCIVGDFAKEIAEEALKKHVPKKVSIEDKLASVGLELNDLKKALGLA